MKTFVIALALTLTACGACGPEGPPPPQDAGADVAPDAPSCAPIGVGCIVPDLPCCAPYRCMPADGSTHGHCVP